VRLVPVFFTLAIGVVVTVGFASSGNVRGVGWSVFVLIIVVGVQLLRPSGSDARSKTPRVRQADLIEDLQRRAGREDLTPEQFMTELGKIQEEVEKAESGALGPVGVALLLAVTVFLFVDPENRSWVVANVVLFAAVFVAARWRRLQMKVKRLRHRASSDDAA